MIYVPFSGFPQYFLEKIDIYLQIGRDILIVFFLFLHGNIMLWVLIRSTLGEEQTVLSRNKKYKKLCWICRTCILKYENKHHKSESFHPSEVKLGCEVLQFVDVI